MELKPIKIPKIELTKQRVVKFSRIVEIIVIVALDILSDYFTTSGTMELITSLSYWLGIALDLILILAIMVTVRAMRKDKRILEKPELVDCMDTIAKGYKRITFGGLSTKLDDYLVRVNKRNKYETFVKAIQKKLIKLGNKNKPKHQQLRDEYNRLLKLNEDEVNELQFKYKKVTVSQLWSAVDGRIINDNEYDLNTYEKQDIGKMLGLRSLFVFLVSAFAGTFVITFLDNGIGAIITSLLKMFSLLWAINTSINIADEFVDHNLTTAVQRRLRILAGFVMETPELKPILPSDKVENKEPNNK